MNSEYSNMFPELIEELDIHAHDSCRKIFVNRNLKMKKVKMIGFDMDYTLAAYYKKEIEFLQYNLVKEKLVKEKDFPKDLLNYQYDPNFVIIGLSLDLDNGNLVKLDRYNTVTRAYKGIKPISEEEMLKVYKNKHTPLKLEENFVRIDTLFSLPETCLFSQIVENFPVGTFYKSYKELYKTVRLMTDTIHRDGSLKAIIKANLSKYIHKDVDLPLTLHNFINSGKKLFLLTNSYYEYTKSVMSYLLDEALPEYSNWRDYFELIIVGSKKPDFFSKGSDPIPLDKDGNKVNEDETNIFQGGNLALLEEKTGLKGDKILYIGDHIYGDILKVKKASMWRTCLIVEALEEEIVTNKKLEELFERLKQFDWKINVLDSELNYQKMIAKSLKKSMKASKRVISSLEKKVFSDLINSSEKKISKISKMISDVSREYHILRNTIDRNYNKYWGMIFKEHREKTKFGEQLESFACLYTSRVTNFLFYSPNQYFRSPIDIMPHEL